MDGNYKIRKETLKIKAEDIRVGPNMIEQDQILPIHIEDEYWVPAPECCIYRVPRHISEINIEAYTPRVISIGPLHHGKSELADMEKQKNRYKREFRKRIDLEKWKELEAFIEINRKTIANCYEDNSKLKSPEFEKIVLLDAIFIIEYLLRIREDQSDYLIYTPWLRYTILRDLKLLENQLPYFVIEGLYMKAFANAVSKVSPFLTLCCDYIFPKDNTFYFKKLERLELKHFTDLIRHSWLSPHLKDKSKAYFPNLPNAVKLQESGLKFRHVAEEPNFLTDLRFVKRRRLISLFEVDELHMPNFEIFDDTESLIRNLMAFEQCHYYHDTHICNYIRILDDLINTSEDVDLLVENGILATNMGNYSATANMINKLRKNIILSKSSFVDIAVNLEKHYNNPWNRVQATLLRVYFNNLWRGTGTIAAVILLVLTLVQTICSIFSAIPDINF